MFTSDEWEITTECIVGLYPKWNLTDEQASVFRGQFHPLHQASLREAVRRLWIEDKFGGATPHPGKLKAMYERVRGENEAVERASQSRAEDRATDWEEIERSKENTLRRVLMAGVTACSSAASVIRSGLGRWGWIKPAKCKGDDPNNWSTMMQAAVLYEIENPSSEDAKEGDDDESDDAGNGGPVGDLA